MQKQTNILQTILEVQKKKIEDKCRAIRDIKTVSDQNTEIIKML